MFYHIKKLFHKITSPFFNKALDIRLAELQSLLAEDSHPNMTRLSLIARDMDAIKLNIKNFGYDLARDLREAVPYKTDANPVSIPLESKACTQADVESQWFYYWCGQLRVPPIYHRKIWEFAYLLQSLKDSGMLIRGKKAIVFACGEEPIPSYLASLGIEVVVTDLHPEKVSGTGWETTAQHTSSLEKVYYEDIISRQDFEKHVSLEYVDMNAIPEHLDSSFDFCWSICSLEHLGSIENGLRFIENSMNVLKTGGVSVQTTEFNYLDTEQTIDNWPTVLFQKKHFEDVAQRLVDNGHSVAPLNFSVGTDVLDKFIDLPPYSEEAGVLLREQWSDIDGYAQAAHLRLNIDGFASTCFGMTITKH